MAFKKPAAYQQPAAGSQPAQLEHDVQVALANLLGHHNVGQWASDHSQEGKSFQGWNYLAIAAIGRQAARAHGYVYSAAPQAVAKRKAAIQKWGSLWKSMAQDGSADAVGDDNWVARMVDKPNRTQSGALFRWEFIRTGREWRAIRGLPPYGDWRDDAQVTSQGFVVDEAQPPKKAESAGGPGDSGGMEPPGNPFARAMTKGFAKAIPNGKPGPVIAVDLDGTLAEYHGDFDPDLIGHPNPVAIQKMNQMKRAGFRIVIFTCREDNELLRG